MSTNPDVSISRDETGNVTAEGGDALATTLLRRAGFVPESSVHQHWHRLPWDMGEQRENEMASHAATMLSSVGCGVALDRSLDVRRTTTPTDPEGRLKLGLDLLDLTDQLNGARTYATASAIVDQVLDPTDGVLVRLHGFFEAASERTNEVAEEAGWELADRFTDAADEISGISESLTSASDKLRALGPSAPEPPRWQAKAAERARAAGSSPHGVDGREDQIAPAQPSPSSASRRTR